MNNVVTLASVANIVNLGGERYAGMGVNRSKGTLAFQLAGNIKRGGLVENHSVSRCANSSKTGAVVLPVAGR